MPVAVPRGPEVRDFFASELKFMLSVALAREVAKDIIIASDVVGECRALSLWKDMEII